MGNLTNCCAGYESEDYVDAGPVKSEKSAVVSALGDLERRIGETEQLIETLRTRLESVLHSVPENPATKREELEASCPLAEAIQQHSCRVESIQNRLEEILDRIEL